MAGKEEQWQVTTWQGLAGCNAGPMEAGWTMRPYTALCLRRAQRQWVVSEIKASKLLAQHFFYLVRPHCGVTNTKQFAFLEKSHQAAQIIRLPFSRITDTFLRIGTFRIICHSKCKHMDSVFWHADSLDFIYNTCYGLSCVLPKFICLSPDPQYVRM